MTRRPRSRLPPKLPDPARDAEPRPSRGPSTRDRLKTARVSGRSTTFGSSEILAVMRRVTRNDRTALLGCPAFEGITPAQVQSTMSDVYGWDGDGPRPRIAGSRTVDGFAAACERVLEVARNGGRIAFATTCPASLFTLHRALAEAAAAAGGNVFDAAESAPFDERSRDASRLRWLDRVAMVTDGRALPGDGRSPQLAAEEWAFTVGHPDLVVSDRTFAGHAVATGVEVVAFAGLDALALGVASWRGLAVRTVPLDERRPPRAYEPLVDLLGKIAKDA
jgi:hypothetical protein